MIVTVPAGPFDPDWESLARYKPPEWYLDAKFGIFIHWGVYSVPAFGSEWYPRNMYIQDSPEFKHHLAAYGPQKEFGYKDFIPLFQAEKYDPSEWANLFKQAGAKYVVPVAEHHDGFPLYDTALSDWCAAKMGPKRDLIGELAQAVRKEGMVFGASSHRAEHWWFMNGGKTFDSDVNDPKYAAFYGPAAPEEKQPDEEYLDDWLARTCEMVDKYRPQLVWFDWWIEQPSFRPYLKRFAAYYYNRAAEWGLGAAINYKYNAFPKEAAVFDIERGQLADIPPYFWQTDTAVAKNSWGYTENQEYKSAASLVHDLVDVVSKNGCLLLNIGPRADGSIPEPDRERLLEIGRWLHINGEAIYGSRPWKVYGEGPTNVEEGAFTDTNRPPFTPEDIRYTIKGNTIYAILLSKPVTIRATLRSLSSALTLNRNTIERVSLLGLGDSLKFKCDSEGLHVELPAKLEGEHAFTLKIEREQGKR